jgi:hypothetical protein
MNYCKEYSNGLKEEVDQKTEINKLESLQTLYDSGIKFSISSFLFGGIDIQLGDKVHGIDWREQKDTVKKAIDILLEKAKEIYPNLDYVKELTEEVDQK